MKYRIIRFYKEEKKHRRKLIKDGLTLKEAQKHCKDPKTRKEGIYFDGYEKDLCTNCGQQLK